MAADFRVAEPRLGAAIPVSSTGTFNSVTPPPHDLGQTVIAVDMQSGSADRRFAGAFVFCRGSDVASIGQYVHIINNSAVALNVNNSASMFPIGVAAGVLSATNVYGWVQVAGVCDFAKTMSGSNGTDGTVDSGVKLYIGSNSDSAGYVLPDAVAGNLIIGLVPIVTHGTTTTGKMTVSLNYPQVAGVTAGL